MTLGGLLLEALPELRTRLAKHPKSVTLPSDRLSAALLQQLEALGIRAEPLRSGKVRLCLPEAYSLPEAETSEMAALSPYDEWCRRIRLNLAGRAGLVLPGRALWHAAGASDLTRVLDTLNRLEGGRLYTWSSLGSELFNDSKRIRAGALREWLEANLDAFGLVVEDNPYTSCVVTFLPGIDAMPRARTLEEVGIMDLPTGLRRAVSFENAAPFRDAVTVAPEHTLLIYTSGNPNHAVRRLLMRLPANLPYWHAGDTDADGFLIAERLFRCHPGIMVMPPAGTPTLPLSPEQLKRAQKRLRAADGDTFPVPNLRSLPKRGTWIEQEAWSCAFCKTL